MCPSKIATSCAINPTEAASLSNATTTSQRDALVVVTLPGKGQEDISALLAGCVILVDGHSRDTEANVYFYFVY